MEEETDICRVCRSEGNTDQPLFHPCFCTGSIKYVHEACLVRWLAMRRNEFCEICKNKFHFRPIYREDTPQVMPISEFVIGLVRAFFKWIQCWLHYALVAFIWLLLVPFVCCRIFKFFFSSPSSSYYTMFLNFVRLQNVAWDCITGFLIVGAVLFLFIGIVYLRDQIITLNPAWIQVAPIDVMGGGPRVDVPPVVNPGANPGPAENNPVNNDVAAPMQEDDDEDVYDFAPSDHEASDDDTGNEQDHAITDALLPIPPQGETARNDDLAHFQRAAALLANARENARKNRQRTPSTTTQDHQAETPTAANPQGPPPAAEPPQEPPAPPPAPPQQAANNNWNWNGPGGGMEELTWERLLGLDGSLVFLEHVVWVVTINLVSIFLFAYLPYLAGRYLIGYVSSVLVLIRGRGLDTAHLLSMTPNDNQVGSSSLRNHYYSSVSMVNETQALPSNATFAQSVLVFASHGGPVGLRRFATPTTILIGYCFIASNFLLFHEVFKAIGLVKRAPNSRSARVAAFFGKCYLISKVMILLVAELGFFPLFCGTLLDAFTLSLFDTSPSERITSICQAPATYAFLHWIVGMVVIFYFTSFIILLRELVRPGVLFFLKNVSNPDYNPVYELLEQSVVKHALRWVFSSLLLATILLFTTYLPIQAIKVCFPGMLPFNLIFNTQYYTFSQTLLELGLLQLTLPAVLEYGHLRRWIKFAAVLWLRAASYLFGLKSYLLGDPAPGDIQPDGSPFVPPTSPDDPGRPGRDGEELIIWHGHPEGGDIDIDIAAPVPPVNPVNPAAAAANPPPEQAGNQLGDRHQQFYPARGPWNLCQAYWRPRHFKLRLLGLLLFMVTTLFFVSIVTLTLPVAIGRELFKLELFDLKPVQHEIFTAFFGAFILWCAGVAISNVVLVKEAFFWIVETLTVVTTAPTTTPTSAPDPHSTESPTSSTTSIDLPPNPSKVATTVPPRTPVPIISRGLECIFRITAACKAIAGKSLKSSARVLSLIPTCIGLFVVIPLLVGACFYHYFFIYLKVSMVGLNSTPLYQPVQLWVTGLVLTKIVVALAMTFPGDANFLRPRLDALYADGIWRHDPVKTFKKLVWPCVFTFGILLAIPYVIQYSLLPAIFHFSRLQVDPKIVATCQRLVHASLSLAFISGAISKANCSKLRNMYTHIKNDRYMVGRQLMNYDARSREYQ